MGMNEDVQERGIAIVEDKYLPELNPNVAMEWGWMRGMGRNVLYLVEKDFKKQRAEFQDLLRAIVASPVDTDAADALSVILELRGAGRRGIPLLDHQPVHRPAAHHRRRRADRRRRCRSPALPVGKHPRR